MKYILILASCIFSLLSFNHLYAVDESDEEGEVVVVSTKKAVQSEYDQAVQLFSDKFDQETALQLLPQRFNTTYLLSWMDPNQRTPIDLWNLLQDQPLTLIHYGLKTLLPDSSLRFVYSHFASVTYAFCESVDKMEGFLVSTKKLQFHDSKNLEDVMDVISGVKDFDPGSTVVLWDLHGTLTKMGTPRYGETNVAARNLTSEVVNDLAKSGAKNVIVSAWDNIDDVVAQIKHIGLAEIFEIPESYKVEKGDLPLNGIKVSYVRVGQVVSVKINPNEHYYKDKIYALDVLGLSPKTLIFVDDSVGNLSKAVIHFANTKASESVDSFHLIHLASVQEDEPAKFTEDFLSRLKKSPKKDE